MALSLALAGCGGSGNGTTTVTYTAKSSFVQKGPFIRFSPVTVQELDQNLAPKGRTFNYQTITDIGTFSPTAKFETKYISLTASGNYFDEIANKVSADPVTLSAYVDLSTENSVNINLLTTLVYQRIQTLVTQSKLGFDAARDQAEKEVLAAFKIRNIAYVDFNGLNISRTGDNDSILLAISSVFLQAANTLAQAANTSTSQELTQLIAGFASDLADDGVINDATQMQNGKTLMENLTAASQSVDLDILAANLTARYRTVVTLTTPLTAANLVKWLDRDGDGVIEKNSLIQENAKANTANTSTAYLVGAGDDGTVASLELLDPSAAGILKINGKQYPSSGAIVRAGDKITITLTAGANPNDAVAAYLDINSTRVEKYTVVTAPLTVTLAVKLQSVGSPSGMAISKDSKTLFFTSMPTVSAAGVPKDNGGLYIYDVTTPSAPSLLKREQDPVGGLAAGYYGVALSDANPVYTAYIADSQQQMQVVDINLTDPANPTATLSSQPPASTVSPAMSIVQSAQGLPSVFVGTSGYNVKQVDVTNPASPSVKDTQNVNSQPWGLTISPDDSQLIAYSAMSPIADEMDISVNAAPPPAYQLGSVTSISNILPAGVMAAAYCGNKQIFAAGVSGKELSFATVDLGSPSEPSASPSAPIILGQGVAAISAYDGTGVGVSYSADTNMAYVVVMGEVFLIDLTDLSKPIIRGNFILPIIINSSTLVLPPTIAASRDGASVYASWNGALFVLHVGN